jgi:hypothetical protein
MQPGHDVTCTYTAWHWDAAPPEAPARLSRSVRAPFGTGVPHLVADDGPQPATAVTPACLAMKAPPPGLLPPPGPRASIGHTPSGAGPATRRPPWRASSTTATTTPGAP